MHRRVAARTGSNELSDGVVGLALDLLHRINVPSSSSRLLGKLTGRV